MLVQPYLFFEGKCEEALAFYHKALGAEIGMKLRFKEAPPAPSGDCMTPQGAEEKIMHTEFRVGTTSVMASDGRCSGQPNFQGFSLSLTPANDEEAKNFFGALSEGGQVQMPLGPTFFASSFGMVADKFGVSWMIYVPAK